MQSFQDLLVLESITLKKRIQELEKENHDLLHSKAEETRLFQQVLVAFREEKQNELEVLQRENQALIQRIEQLEHEFALRIRILMDF